MSLNLTSNPLSTKIFTEFLQFYPIKKRQTNLHNLDVLVFNPNFICQKTSMEKIPWHLTRETAQLHYHSLICNAQITKSDTMIHAKNLNITQNASKCQLCFKQPSMKQQIGPVAESWEFRNDIPRQNLSSLSTLNKFK